MKRFEVWCEGFAVTGQREPATKVGEVEAETFADACRALYDGNPDFSEKSLTHWGCRLFDNEADARKFCG